MTTTIEYLEAVKAKTGAGSDYALAKKLNLTRAAVSKYRNSVTYFDDTTCLKVASILEIDPLIVISEMNVQRSKDESVKQLWRTMLERLGGVAASLLIATGISVSNPSPANAAADAMGDKVANNGVYYVKSRRRQQLKSKRKIDLSFLISNIMQTA